MATIPSAIKPSQASTASQNLGLSNVSAPVTSSQNFSNFTANIPSSAPVQKVASSTVTAPAAQTYTAPTYSAPTNPVQPLININTTTVPSSAVGSGATASGVMNYRQQLQDQYNAYLGSQTALQNNAVQAGLYSNDYINQLNQQRQQNQGYRQGTLDIRSKVIPLEFQTGQQQQIDLQHSLDSQATGENLNFLENQRANNLQAAQAQVGYGQQNYQNAFAQTQAAQANDINLAQVGISQQQANTAAQSAGYGRYDYQQITDPTTGFPTVVTIDKVTGKPIGTYSPGGQNQTSNSQATGGDALQNALVSQESGGNYQAVSPAGALGKYQIMPDTLKGLGINVSAQQFLSSPQIQDQAFQALYSELSNRYGGDPAKIAAAYYGGGYGAKVVGTPEGDKPQKGGFPSINSYVSSVLNKAQGEAPQRTATGGLHYDEIVKAAPTLIANAIKPLPGGGAYVDAGLLADSKYNVMATNFAKQAGIRVVPSSESTVLNSITQSVTNLNQMASTFGNLAADSALGTLGNTATNGLSKLFDTNYGSQLKAFQSDRDGLLQQVKALAGSSPRLNGNELNIAANALPNLNGLSKDTLKDGVNKLVRTQAYLDNAIRAYVPDYAGTPVSINGQYAVLGSDGKTYSFPDSDTAIKFLAASKKS